MPPAQQDTVVVPIHGHSDGSPSTWPGAPYTSTDSTLYRIKIALLWMHHRGEAVKGSWISSELTFILLLDSPRSIESTFVLVPQSLSHIPMTCCVKTATSVISSSLGRTVTVLPLEFKQRQCLSETSLSCWQ